MRRSLIVLALLASGCGERWGRLEPGRDGVLAQPADSKLGTVLATGKIVGLPRMDPDAGPSYEPVKPMPPLELSPGQRARLVTESPHASADDRGRPIGVLILDGPHHGLHVRIRRDQFTPRPSP